METFEGVFLRHFWLLGAIVALLNYGLFRKSFLLRVSSTSATNSLAAERLFRLYHLVGLALCFLLYALQSAATRPEAIFLFASPSTSPAVTLSWLLFLSANVVFLALLWRSPQGLLLAQVAFNGALPAEDARSLLTVMGALLVAGLFIFFAVLRAAA